MGYTKRQFVEMAFDEIGMRTVNLQGEQMQSALQRLDSMMAMWNKRGIRISFPMTSSPEDSSLDTETTVPDSANEAIYTNLALRLCSPFGKQPMQDLVTRADDLYKNLLTSTFKINEVNFDTLPQGAGNKYWRLKDQRFINDSSDSDIDVGTDSALEF